MYRRAGHGSTDGGQALPGPHKIWGQEVSHRLEIHFLYVGGRGMDPLVRCCLETRKAGDPLPVCRRAGHGSTACLDHHKTMSPGNASQAGDDDAADDVAICSLSVVDQRLASFRPPHDYTEEQIAGH